MSNSDTWWGAFLGGVATGMVIAVLCIFFTGCATANRWTPCPTGFSLDVHQTLGRYDGSSEHNTGEADGYDSNYESTRFGGSMHFALGRAPSECRVYGGTYAD